MEIRNQLGYKSILNKSNYKKFTKRNKLYLYKDLICNEFVLTDYKKSIDRYKYIFEFDKRDNVYNIRNQYEIAYNGSIICKSTAERLFKGQNIETGFICEVNNPHYKCGSPMRLYDRNVIEYKMFNQR